MQLAPDSNSTSKTKTAPAKTTWVPIPKRCHPFFSQNQPLILMNLSPNLCTNSSEWSLGVEFLGSDSVGGRVLWGLTSPGRERLVFFSVISRCRLQSVPKIFMARNGIDVFLIQASSWVFFISFVNIVYLFEAYVILCFRQILGWISLSDYGR